jgi:RNA polymerase sigma factor (sigma-70 family)
MANSEDYLEDPLERLLDKESDEEFGAPEYREHLADSLTPAVLKDWSAADFASIYVRFRPHLERHARRYLVNPSQVEEVVQDAFLYLMTTLPELDSEVGVLKFLKWKTRLLCLDVIRINSRVSIAPLDDQPEIAANSPEMSLEMERADDAAIVSMALAKLQPRHREVLIASIYEEKSTDAVAEQLGLSENATRQLLFRARSAFKKALIGEVETAGMSAGQILSVAARKAAAESGKYVAAAGAFLLVMAVSLGVLPNINQTTTNQIASAPSESSEALSPGTTGEASATEAVEAPAASAAPAEPQKRPRLWQVDRNQFLTRRLWQQFWPRMFLRPVTTQILTPLPTSFRQVSAVAQLRSSVARASLRFWILILQTGQFSIPFIKCGLMESDTTQSLKSPPSRPTQLLKVTKLS